MTNFEFSTNVIPLAVDELAKAQKFVKIAVFQIHAKDVFDVLREKIRRGVKVEIITLPVDSINADVREEVESNLLELQKLGAKLFFNAWNVGDPSRTTTAVGRWYAFHGKFMVTDKSAVSLSANLISANELDAILIYDSQSKIDEYDEKFEELKKLYVLPCDGYRGDLHSRVLALKLPGVDSVFNLPENISKEHVKTWIQHYPVALCPDVAQIQDGLFVTPTDLRGRDFLERAISEAKDFAYLSSETFTDQPFANFLQRISLSGVQVKVLTGYGSMDFSDRIQIITKDLLAANVDVRTTIEDLHAKLLVTDKILAVTSINLNNINLGFFKAKGFWRENTETVTVCMDAASVNQAKKQFESIFVQSSSLGDVIAERNLPKFTEFLNSTFNCKFKKDARLFLSKLAVQNDIAERKKIRDLVTKAISMAKNEDAKEITKKHLEDALAS